VVKTKRKMLKFSKHAKAASTGRLSPETRDAKKQKLEDIPDIKQTDVEVNQESTSISEEFETLKKKHDEFVKFLDAVSSDLATKTEKLKALKDCANTKLNDKSYAGVQLFMLGQYSQRITRFREVSTNSLENISRKVDKDGDHPEMITKHIDILGKMKRRMKHIIDVSDKYAVENIFEGINLLKEMSEQMEHNEHTEKSLKMGKCKSMNSLHKIRNSIVVSEPDLKENISEGQNFQPKNRKVNTFRSLTDHLTVLTKTYTNRR